MRDLFDGIGLFGSIVIILVLIGAVVLLNTLFFEWIWNDFVVHHVVGAVRTTFSQALLPGILIPSLCGASWFSSRR